VRAIDLHRRRKKKRTHEEDMMEELVAQDTVEDLLHRFISENTILNTLTQINKMRSERGRERVEGDEPHELSNDMREMQCLFGQ
jgi:hypothetical protein